MSSPQQEHSIPFNRQANNPEANSQKANRDSLKGQDKNSESLRAKFLRVELLRACTPIVLAAIGAVIGLAALYITLHGEADNNAGFGLASTAIAGAAGLAQTHEKEH